MKKRNYLIITLLISFLIPFAGAKAAELKTGDIIKLSEGEMVSGNLYASGAEIIVDGNISGDLIAAAEKITVNGELGGDLIAIASEIEVNGLIGGNVRAAASKIIITGEIKRNASIAADKISFEKNSVLSWDLASISDEISLNGKILGGINSTARNAGINSEIEKNVVINLNGKESSLIISPDAKIKGNLNYKTQKESFVNNQGLIQGQTTATEKFQKNDFDFWPYAAGRLMAILAALLTAVIIFYATKKHGAGIIKKIEENPLQNILYGAAIVFAGPVIMLICAITIIGLPLALSAAAIYAALLYLAKVLSAIFIGQIIFEKIIKKDSKSFLAIVLGIVICWFIFSIPYVGIACALAATSLGLGGILKYVRN